MRWGDGQYMVATVALALGVGACGEELEAGDTSEVTRKFGPPSDPGGTCKPQENSCYVAGPDGPGNECLAQRDNDGEDGRVQLRQTWSRNVRPARFSSESG